MKNDEIKLAEAENNQKKFKSSLGKIEKRKQQKKIKGTNKRAIQY